MLLKSVGAEGSCDVAEGIPMRAWMMLPPVVMAAFALTVCWVMEAALPLAMLVATARRSPHLRGDLRRLDVHQY
jgi:hypothetical protein